MVATEFYKLSDKKKFKAIEETAKQIDMPLFTVEKDWWVVQTLDIIFQMDCAKNLIFKGGTSLSKAWQIINRFSEDIDLVLNREFLGFDAGLISKSQVKKLRKKSFEFVTTTFFENLQKAFKNKGYNNVTFGFENLSDGDQDPVSILIYYPTVTSYSNYVLPRVKVELGSRSLKEPFTNRKIQSFIGKQFQYLPFADQAFEIACVNPERTFLEKLFLLHEEFQKPKGKIRVNRLSRHLYDLVKIYQSEHKNKAYDINLIKSIIEHRERFNAMRGIDYNSLYPPNLNAIPPKELIKDWQADYITMQNFMIPEESPDFTELTKIVRQVINEYNNLKIK